MRPEGPWQPQDNKQYALYDFPKSYPRPASSAATHELPYRHGGAFLPSPPEESEIKKGTKENMYKRQRKVHSQGGPARPPLPSFSTLGPLPRAIALLPPSPPPTPPQGVPEWSSSRPLYPRRKVRTAGVACSSWKSSLTEGARGCFHSQAFPMLFHSSLIWGDRARKLAKRWRRGWRPLFTKHSDLE